MTTSQSVRKTAIKSFFTPNQGVNSVINPVANPVVHPNVNSIVDQSVALARPMRESLFGFSAVMLLCLFWLASLGASLGVASAQSAENDRPPFFKVEYQGKQAYLLGSIHVGREDFYPMPAQIEQAFANAKALVIEADISKANVPALLKRFGLSKIGERSNNSTVLMDYCVNNAGLCQALSGYAPWLKAAQIGMYRFGGLGYKAEQGVDSYWVAKKGAKTLMELESVAFQFELIASFKPKTQQAMLDEAISADDAEMLELIEAWRTGNNQKLAQIMSAQADDAPELVTDLLWRRNHTMTSRLIELFDANNDKLFVVIGAGHLVGEQAIPDLLKAKGAVITQCWSQDCTKWY